jgi:DNA repair exonuclease SbcCD ATPase subunit
MTDSRFIEWGFLLVTLANVLLIGLVLILLWRRLFPQADEAGADAGATQGAASPAQAAAGLIADVQRQAVLPLERAMSDSLELVGRLDDVDGAAYPDWKKTHQPQIDELLSHREDLEFKLDDLKSKLDRAHKLVTNLHGQNRELRGAEAKLQRLSLEHDRLQASLVETRRERDDLGATVARLEEELGRLRQPPLGPAATAPAGADDPLQLELETLRERLEEEQAKLSRTLVEKEFIEQVFIDTDAVTDDYQALQREHADLQEQLRVLQTRLASGQYL